MDVNVLITRPVEDGYIDAYKLDQELRAICPKVQSVTVCLGYDPSAVFVHVTEALTEEERAALTAAVMTHRSEPEDGGWLVARSE